MFHKNSDRDRLRILTLQYLTLGIILACLASHVSADEKAKSLHAGAFAIDITPLRFPISSNGGLRDRQVAQAHDPLHARCLVLENGETTLAIAVCDSCMIPRDIFDAAKKLASKLTGIREDHMLMSATHTHSAVTVTGVFQSEPNEEYRQFLIKRIAEGIKQAAANLEPARIGWGSGKDPSQVFNRRWLMRSGGVPEDPFGGKRDRARMNPPRGSDLLDKPSGPIDPEVCLLSVQSRTGKPIALLANYSLHYVGGVPGNSLSADYFGEFAARIGPLIGATRTEPAFVGIMSNGTSGNINNINFSLKSSPRREPFEQIQLVAASVANAAKQAYERIEYHDRVPLVMRETEVELSVRIPNDDDLAAARKLLAEAGPGPYSSRSHIYARETALMANYPARVNVKLQAIRIGEMGIVSSPCENFVETGLAIKKQSPLKLTFTIELANGYNGYLPTPQHHKLGGYETWRARSSYLAEDAEPTIRNTLLKLLEDVSGDSR